MQPFPEANEKWNVSTNGGIAPQWSADGRELYFIAPDGKLMAAPVAASGRTFDAGAPKTLFATGLAGNGIVLFNPQYAVSRDGRFLITQPTEQSGSSPITLILNWNSQHKK